VSYSIPYNGLFNFNLNFEEKQAPDFKLKWIVWVLKNISSFTQYTWWYNSKSRKVHNPWKQRINVEDEGAGAVVKMNMLCYFFMFSSIPSLIIV
jgi:hypothetical protein